MKRVVSILVILLLCFSLTACGGKNDIVGTWHTYDLGVSIDSPELPPYFTFTFHENGTGTGPVGSFDRLDTVSFTYTVGEGVINVATDENKDIVMTYSLDGDTMTLKYDGYTRVLEKVSDDILIECY